MCTVPVWSMNGPCQCFSCKERRSSCIKSCVEKYVKPQCKLALVVLVQRAHKWEMPFAYSHTITKTIIHSFLHPSISPSLTTSKSTLPTQTHLLLPKKFATPSKCSLYALNSSLDALLFVHFQIGRHTRTKQNTFFIYIPQLSGSSGHAERINVVKKKKVGQ